MKTDATQTAGGGVGLGGSDFSAAKLQLGAPAQLHQADHPLAMFEPPLPSCCDMVVVYCGKLSMKRKLCMWELGLA